MLLSQAGARPPQPGSEDRGGRDRAVAGLSAGTGRSPVIWCRRRHRGLTQPLPVSNTIFHCNDRKSCCHQGEFTRAAVRVSERRTSSRGTLTAAGKTDCLSPVLLQLKTTKLRSPGGRDTRTHPGMVRLKAPELFASAFPRLLLRCLKASIWLVGCACPRVWRHRTSTHPFLRLGTDTA